MRRSSIFGELDAAVIDCQSGRRYGMVGVALSGGDAVTGGYHCFRAIHFLGVAKKGGSLPPFVVRSSAVVILVVTALVVGPNSSGKHRITA